MKADPLVSFRPAYAREPITVPLSQALLRGYCPPSTAPTVVVTAPRGACAMRFAEALKAMFGCTSVVEGWDGATPLAPGTLALTDQVPTAIVARGDAAEADRHVA